MTTMNALKTFELTELKSDPTLPNGIWDPMWEKPEVATRVAMLAYKQLRLEAVDFGEAPLIDAADLQEHPKKRIETRTFALGTVHTFEGSATKLRAGSYGEVFKRYTFGAGSGKASVNFHIQGLVFGVDSEGRWLVKGTVGRVDGGWGTKAGFVLQFVTKNGKTIGGVQCECELDPPKDVPVQFLGRDARLAADFDSLKEATLTFFSDPG